MAREDFLKKFKKYVGKVFKNEYFYFWLINEVIAFRVIMYANPLLIVKAMYSTFKGQLAYYSIRGVISENISFHLKCRFHIRLGDCISG